MYRLITLAFLSALIITITACGQSDRNYVKVKNSLSQDRPDARVTFSRNQLSGVQSALNDSSFSIQDENGNDIPHQLDDMNGDGKWDEVALLVDLKAGESKKLSFEKSGDVSAFTDRTNIHFGKLDSTTGNYHELTHEVRSEDYQRDMTTPFYYQFEGPGWENDNIGFRMYFDDRNAFDIWGKTTSDMVLDSVGTGEDYHSLQPWGMDVLKVGNSLGAGAIAVMENDSLYQLGATDHTEFRQIADGPVRAVFDLIHKGWKVADKDLAVRQRITLWGGQQGYQNEVSLLTDDANTTLAAGFVTVNLSGNPDYNKDGQPFPYVAGWGQQSLNDDYLGIGVAGEQKPFEGYGQRNENPEGIEHSAFLKLNLTSQQPVRYVFVTGWEGGNKDFSQKENFIQIIQDEGRRLNNPVEIVDSNR